MQKNQFTKWLAGFSKRTWGIIGAIIVIVAGTAIYFNVRKTDVLKQTGIKVEYTGYNGSGYASVNTEQVIHKAFVVTGKKAGLTDPQVRSIESDPQAYRSDSSQVWNAPSITSGDREKAHKALAWLDELHLTTNHTSGLSNGDHVTVQMKVDDDKTNPIKASSQTFKVSGLKKVQSSSTQSIINHLEVKFSGFNKHGETSISSSRFKHSGAEFHIKGNGHLSNGDKLTITIPDELTTRTGVRYSGPRTFSKTVSGLTDLSNVGGLDDVQKLMDSMMANDFKNNDFSHYTVTMVNMFIDPLNKSSDSSGWASQYSNSDSDVTSTVSLNSNNNSTNKNKVGVIALYSVQDDNSDDSDPQLQEVILSNVPYVDKKLSVSHISTDKNGSNNSVSDSRDTELHNLNAQYIKVK